MILEDGNEDQHPQAEIYAPGGTVAEATVDLTHQVKGRYEGSWTPTTVGAFAAQFFVYSDAGHAVENITYVRAIEQIFVTQSDIDDLAAAVIRLLGLNHENAFIDNTDFDIYNQLVTCRIRIYDSKTNAEAAADGDNYSTGLIATYTMEAEHEGAGKLKTYRYVKSS